MSRICVPGLLALLAAAPLTVRADDKVEAAKPPVPVPAAAPPPAADKPVQAPDKPAAEKPAADKPAPEKPAAAPADKPAAEQPAADKPAAEKPAAGPAPAKPAAPLKLIPGLRLNLGELIKAKAAAPAKVAAAPVKAAGKDDDEEEEKKLELSEEDKKVFDEFVQKALKTKKKMFEDAMKTEIESVVKEAKLERDAEKKLAALSGKAVEAALPDWEKSFRKWIETLLPRAGGSAKALSSWSADGYARNSTLTDFTLPAQTDAWKAALKEVLTPEQLKTREEAVKAAEKKFQEDFGDYLATIEGQAGDQMSAAIEAEITRIVQFSGLDEERRKKLKAAGDEAVKQCVKEWRLQMEKQLKTMDPKQREMMASRGGMAGVNMTDKTYQPKERPVWKDAMALLLKEQERQTLEARYQEVRARRADALALLLVNDLDKLVGFSADQRQQFLPIAAKRLLKLPDYYFVDPQNGGFSSLDMGQMLTQAQKVKDDELKPFLSETQLKRFRDASPDQMSRNNYYTREKLDLGDVPKPEDMDEVEVERLFSRYLHREAKKMKLKMFSTMEAQVEHVTRATHPSPETIGVLTTAAKGAAEELAQSSVLNTSAWLRSQFQNVKPSDVPAKLENLYAPYYYERNQQTGTPALWTSAVQRLLDEEQRKLWKAETDLREKWRREALSVMVISEVEKRVVMSEEQRAKLRPKVDSVIQEYEPDFASYFSFGWHLQGYYSLIPIAMFSEKEMAEHFDKKQVELLKDKSLGNSMQYAEMIRNNHNSRIRRQ